VLTSWRDRSFDLLLAEHGLNELPEREFPTDGWSGARFTMIERGRDRFVIKRTSLARDWIASATDDVSLREACVAASVIGGADPFPYLGAATDGDEAAILMPDLSVELLEWDRTAHADPLGRDDLDRVLAGLAQLHQVAWPGVVESAGTFPWTPLPERLLLTSRPMCARHIASGIPSGIASAERLLAGWDAFDRQATPPARALMTLGLARVAEGSEDEGARLLDRALALAPEDRDVVRESAGAAETRAEAVLRLTRYLGLSDGDDPDRIEGAKGTIRTYKALGERRVWVRATRPERVEVPLASVRTPSGALTGYSLAIAAPPGKPIRVLLDTGSPGLFLVERIAAKAGLTTLAEETTFGGGGEGRHPNKSALLESVAIGDLRFTDALVTTTTQEIEPTGRYHGILGVSIFQGYRVTLDLAREKLILEALPPGSATARAAGAPGGGATAASPAALSAGSPYWSVESQMLVEAASADGRTGLFLFDTGATASLLSLDFADAARAWIGGENNARGYGGVLRDAREVRGVKLRFQGLETSGAPMTASDLAQRSRLGGVEVSGYLGLDLLARSLVTVDTVARRVTVTKPGKR
jgi:hypothetical protein